MRRKLRRRGGRLSRGRCKQQPRTEKGRGAHIDESRKILQYVSSAQARGHDAKQRRMRVCQEPKVHAYTGGYEYFLACTQKTYSEELPTTPPKRIEQSLAHVLCMRIEAS